MRRRAVRRSSRRACAPGRRSSGTRRRRCGCRSRSASPTASQTRVRLAFGSGRPSASVSRRPSSSTGAAARVDQPPEVVDRVAVLGAQREALAVDPRQAGRVRAGVGRVDVAAEVERLGLARRDQRVDRPRAGEAHHRAATRARGSRGARTRPRPGRRSSLRHSRAPRRRSAAASTDSSWPAVLNVPFASTVPSASSATANGLPGTSAAAHASASRTSSNVAQLDARVAAEGGDGGRERAAHLAALGGEHGERDAARRVQLEALGERAARADLRPLVGDLERPARVERQPQHPDLAREREHGDAERDEPDQRGAEPDREPALGGRLGARQQRRDGQRGREQQRAAERAAARPVRARRSRRTASRRGRTRAPRPGRPRSRPSARRRRTRRHRPRRRPRRRGPPRRRSALPTRTTRPRGCRRSPAPPRCPADRRA